MKNRPPFAAALTFDDVLLVPQKSTVLPREVDIRTRLTNNIVMNIPLLSAAMDTVTESKMAIALAREGGIGVIHKNLTISGQVKMVDRVKRSESGMIMDPITMDKNKTIREAKAAMSHYHVSGFPVLEDGKLVGILTNRDIRFETNLDLTVSDCMTSENLITVPVGTTLDKAKDILQEYRIEKLLVVDKNGKLAGLITVKDIQKKEDFPNACLDENGRLRVGAAVGVGEDSLERAEALANANVDIIVIDTAHGHSSGVLAKVASIKKKVGDRIGLIAGNVATADAVQALIDVGIDCVKVGIGAGASCTTRVIAGVGVPQLTAVMNCVDAAVNQGIPIIADGGIRYTGDIPKAIAAGADCVMLGSLLAGTKESPGETIIYEGRKFKTYRGMGSIEAMKQGSKDRYFQDIEDDIKKLVPEGIVGRVPYKGELYESIHQFVGGLRAGMGYCGAKDIATLKETGRFVRITASGINESHPHDVAITKESPNYSRR